jgi:hypothetical protein
MKAKVTMAKAGKVKEGANQVSWRPPAADDIKAGDVLQYYSIDNRFTFRVLSVQHGGEWVFGRDTRDQDEKLGPIAVRRTDCMTLPQAAKVLKDLPSISVDGPVLDPLE